MSEHTPLPWQIEKGKRCGENSIHTVEHHPQLHGPLPVVTLAMGIHGTFISIKDDDAKFIVDACNSHEKLIAENKRLRKDLFIILGYLTGRMDFYESVNDTKSFELVSGIKKSIEQALNESE